MKYRDKTQFLSRNDKWVVFMKYMEDIFHRVNNAQKAKTPDLLLLRGNEAFIKRVLYFTYIGNIFKST